ncbi:uncharacterized protein LOC143198901 [Rhynchophorus ferrugineus]|uniref:uncharacterized protein LOC143198901 n=1 Tax=Rhynchophorus ferrugineus TaxID=354439 RepID=UPI003FCEB3AB
MISGHAHLPIKNTEQKRQQQQNRTFNIGNIDWFAYFHVYKPPKRDHESRSVRPGTLQPVGPSPPKTDAKINRNHRESRPQLGDDVRSRRDSTENARSRRQQLLDWVDLEDPRLRLGSCRSLQTPRGADRYGGTVFGDGDGGGAEREREWYIAEHDERRLGEQRWGDEEVGGGRRYW